MHIQKKLVAAGGVYSGLESNSEIVYAKAQTFKLHRDNQVRSCVKLKYLSEITII